MNKSSIAVTIFMILTALAPLASVHDERLQNEDEQISASRHSIVVKNPSVDFTFLNGDYAVFGFSMFGEMIRSEMENESEWERAVINWQTDLLVDLFNEVPCDSSALGVQCNSFQLFNAMNISAYNDTENRYMHYNNSRTEINQFSTNYSGRGYTSIASEARVWAGLQNGQDMYRLHLFENESIDTEKTGWLSTYTPNDSWNEYNQNWNNITNESTSSSWDGTSWQTMPPERETNYEEGWENYTIETGDEEDIESEGYNRADPNGSGPTTLHGLQYTMYELHDNGSTTLDESQILAEWGYPVSFNFGNIVIQEWHHALGYWQDADLDTIHDLVDDCPNTPTPHTELDENGCSWEQRDDDGDSVVNPVDDCSDTTSSMTDIDESGCAWEQRDGDDDGILNPYDYCLDTPASETVDTEGLTRGCSASQKDTDGDGISDADDACPGHPDGVDVDADGTPDGCDELIDSDGDGVSDDDDLCAGEDDNIDQDNDGIPDACDEIVDSDRDGVADNFDMCEGHDDTIDEDGDVIPDGCDELIDSDGDGVENLFDMCPGFDDSVDVDGDGIPDGCDSIIDSDDDLVADVDDECPDTPPLDLGLDTNGCSASQRDSDNDGVSDDVDRCPITRPTIDEDQDGCPDDSDGDSIIDTDDKCPNSAANVSIDGTGCAIDNSLMGGVASVESLLAVVAALIGIGIIAVISLMVVRGRRSGRRGDHSADHLFEPRGPDRDRTAAPPPTVSGKMQEDGYEYVEWPQGSDRWWYRDGPMSGWNEWQ